MRYNNCTYLINAWKNAFNIPAKITELLSQINVEESTQFAGVNSQSPMQFTLNIDDSIEPARIDLSFLNELGADKVKEYTGVEIAREITNQINSYCPLASKYQVATDVKFFKGTVRDIAYIDITIDSKYLVQINLR